MPTDAVKNRTFQELFGGTVRFEIPFFQRGYAWEKKQWDQLFSDLEEELLADVNSGMPLDRAEHFFGPIVVLEKRSELPEMKEFLVVDGQQRITTIYLLLGLIMHELEAKQHLNSEALGHALELRKTLVNEVSLGDDYRRLKVFSSKGDRLPTYRMIFGSDHNPNSPFLHTDQQLYRPGHNQVEAFQHYSLRKLKSGFKTVPALMSLAQVLLNCLKVVWIPLSERDDPQAIFESLNDKGMPLSSSELICSYLFRPLQASGDFESLHNDQWLESLKILEDRAAFEEYLRFLFSIGENKMVGKQRRVYVHFKTKHHHLNASMARHQLAEIHDNCRLYRSIVAPDRNPYPQASIQSALTAIAQTRMETSTPFLIAVLRAHKQGKLSDEVAATILQQVLVLLVRRKMTEQPTTAYDTLFPGLLGKIINEPKQIEALHEQFRKANVWVSNQEFEDAFVRRGLYRTRDLPFTRMVLMEIDKRLQQFGQLPDYSTLQSVEHMIPQQIDDHWRNYLGEDAKSEHLRVAVDTIGNLCLLSAPANSSVGRNPFDSKKESYPPLTAIARQVKEHPGPWNIEAVRSRSRSLAQVALDLWKWEST